MKVPIPAHGGRLINRIIEGTERDKLMRLAPSLPKITLSSRQQSDLDMIACGALSPLEGFMGEKDYLSVIDTMRLANGLPWSIPVTLAVPQERAGEFAVGKQASLIDENGAVLAVLNIEEKFNAQREREAKNVYKTTEEAHPGVAAIYKEGTVLLGGKVDVINRVTYGDFQENRKDPAELRKLFEEKKWKRVVAFQTRNPIHRAHEYLTKSALEICDGLLIHPLVGDTKGDDIPASVRMKCYEVLIQNYYPKDRVVLAVNPAAMRYAGPREAVLHAVVRRNFGCTHFIVGRDHAGVGNYYGTYDAQRIFREEFQPGELGIETLNFEHTFYCHACAGMASAKTCPHDAEAHVTLSGTRVRQLLAAGELPPPEFSRPEVAKILVDAYRS